MEFFITENFGLSVIRFLAWPSFESSERKAFEFQENPGLYQLSNNVFYPITREVSSRSREIGCKKFHIVLKFDWRLGSSAVERPFLFRHDRRTLNLYLMAPKFSEVWG